MFEMVTHVQTKDGSLFDSIKQAEDYITDKLCEEVNEIIKKTETYDLKYQDLCTIILALTGTVENAQRLMSILDKHI